MPRMRIVNATDQARFEHPPAFNSTERKRYFDFSQSVLDTAQSLRGVTNQIGFLLAYGYFRAARRFFSPKQYHERDIVFVANVVGGSACAFGSGAYNERTRLNHQKRILELQGFRPFDAHADAQLSAEIAKMTRAHLKPRFIFMRCADFLVEKRIQIPSIRRLTDLIRAHLSKRKANLTGLIDMHLSPDLRDVLENLFIQEEGANRYRLTLLKRISQSMRPGKIKETAADLEVLADLYRQIAPVLENIALGSEGIRYYAGGVQRGEIFQLHRRSQADRHLHAIAFIADQHHRLQDAMVDILLSVIQSFEATVSREYKEEVFARRKTEGARLEKMLDVIDTEVLNPLREIRALVADKTSSDAWKLEAIKAVLAHDQENVVEHLRADIRRNAAADDSEYNQILENRSKRLQNRVSPILRCIALRAETGMTDLVSALEVFRESSGDTGSGMPLAFLKPAERHAVLNGPKGFRVSLSKVFLFGSVYKS